MALVRWGLAFVFLYAGAASLIEPMDWVGYFPPFLERVISQNILLPLFSFIEIGLGGWLLWGKHPREAGAVSFLLFFGIIVVNTNVFGVVFRDVGLSFAALALVLNPVDNSSLDKGKGTV